jgi:D-tyrosyl-tRNA(Tyr) deacylase
LPIYYRRFCSEALAAENLATAEIFHTTMRAVVQRVSRAHVTADSSVTGEITNGLLILLGVGRNDTSTAASGLAERIANLRIFEDDQRKMNRSLLDVKGSALVVSQFTLYGDARGQRRPSFVAAAPAEQAEDLYEEFAEALRNLGVTVATGVFGAMMSVESVNEGPVTILLDSDKTF